MVLVGRGYPGDFGCRRPNVYGWRLIGVGFILSLPFLIWMVGGPEIGAYYLRQLRRAGWVAFLFFYFVNMLGEHFFFHGVLLAAFRLDGRWPAAYAPDPVDRSRWRGVLQWLGFAAACTGHDASVSERVRRWFDLSTGCLWPILGSACLFGLVHVDKDVRELVLSVPGGAILGFLAYRSNSWVTTLILHSGTAAAALLLILVKK
jgi:hypothetical protein